MADINLPWLKCVYYVILWSLAGPHNALNNNLLKKKQQSHTHKHTKMPQRKYWTNSPPVRTSSTRWPGMFKDPFSADGQWYVRKGYVCSANVVNLSILELKSGHSAHGDNYRMRCRRQADDHLPRAALDTKPRSYSRKSLLI